jgi:DNA-binding CsgD family transcriptional regulator
MNVLRSVEPPPSLYADRNLVQDRANPYGSMNPTPPMGNARPRMDKLPGNIFHMELLFDLKTGQIKAVSNNSVGVLGQEVSYLVGRTADQLLALLPHEDQPVVGVLISEISRMCTALPYAGLLSTLVTFELRYILPDGIAKWLRLVIRMVPDDSGLINALKVDVYDISDEDSARAINGHIAYLDAFGNRSYKKFSGNTRNFENLSPREQKILRLMSEGLTSKEIGDMLHISKETVDKSRKTMLTKTGTKNSVELIARFLKTA